MELKPTAKQEPFLACGADIAIFGGGAGSGKTRSLIVDQARWAKPVAGYRGVIFRRTYPEIMNPGALWDESLEIMPHFGGIPTKSDARWDFGRGSWIKFSHLQHESTKFGWQGAQLANISFDELPHFTESTFFYLISRLRSNCGVKPYLRATCNPEPGSWVAKLLDWWIDPLTGYPIMARAGVLRYFIRNGDKMVWGDSPADLPAVLNGKKTRPMSVTFFPALVEDNPHISDDYVSNLASLPLYERMLLLEGNWKVKPEGGMRFKSIWFGEPGNPPASFVRIVRYWDRAGTEPSTRNPDPDWTSGTKIGITDQGTYWVLDQVRERVGPAGVRKLIERTAALDGPEVELWMDQDPGSAGEAEKFDLSVHLAKYHPHFQRPTGSKWVRSAGYATAVENGLVRIAKGRWNDAYLSELQDFIDEKIVKPPPGYHDDQVDSSSGAFGVLGSSLPRARSL